MARIDYADPADFSDRTRELLSKNRNANIFRMLAHSPAYLEQYCRLGGAIRHKGELDPVIRELAITRTGILCEAPYEVAAHQRIGRSVGVTDAQNAALQDWPGASCFDEVQRKALAFTDEIVTLKRPTDATFRAIAEKLTSGALVELQIAVGFYVMTSKFLETFAIDMQSAEEII
jgi:alkylhydroperoxidase family enzyme